MCDNETVKSILTRRTVREYTPEPLSAEEIAVLLECAKWAPSGRNSQSCIVRVITDRQKLDELNLDFKNRVGFDTPAYTRWDTNPVYQNAPALFCIYSQGEHAMDAGIMVENIAVAAKGMGLDSCIIGSVGALLSDDSKWKEYMRVDAEYDFMISIAVGHGNENPEPKPRNDSQFFAV